MEDEDEAAPTEAPRVFLSYTSNNLELARRVVEALEAKGIETWWDK